VIKEKGRTKQEIGFALVLNGVYKGYGYMDNTIELWNPDEYLFYLQPQKDNRDVQRILSYYLHKKEVS
jgi:DNA polymerase-3 subunit epsilon